MERLLKKADELSTSFNLLEDKNGALVYSFDDIVEAIHIVQEDMGIYGATSEEASSTVSGSIATMKSAWQNLVGALGSGTSNMKWFINNFVESAKTAALNILPVIENAMTGISELVDGLAPVITEAIPVVVTDVIPTLLQAGADILAALVKGLVNAVPVLIDEAPGIIKTLADTIGELGYLLWDAGALLISEIASAIVEYGPVLLETVKTVFGQIWDYIALELLNTSYDFDTAFSDIKGFFEKTWTEMQAVWNSLGKPVFDFISSIVKTVRNTFAAKMPEIREFFSSCVSDISSFWENNLKPCFEAIGDFIDNILAPAFETAFNEYIGPAVDNAFNFIKDLWNNLLKPVFTGITDFLTGVFTGNWSQAWEGIKSILTGAWNGYRDTVNTALNSIQNVISTILTAIKGVFTNIWNSGIGTVVTNAINNVKTTISTGLNNALTTVSTVLGNIKNKFSSILDGAKTIVKNAIDGIKGFFNFSWSLPALKLPHISISGSFSLNPPSVPSFGISWYKKAMDEAMLLDGATIFGAYGNTFLGGGEAGPEVVSGANTLMEMIREAAGDAQGALLQVSVQILDLLTAYFPELAENMERAIVLDDGTLVGRIAPQINEELGDIIRRRNR